MQSEEFKECPYCREKIRAAAMKCRFCGEWLEPKPEPPPQDPAKEGTGPALGESSHQGQEEAERSIASSDATPPLPAEHSAAQTEAPPTLGSAPVAAPKKRGWKFTHKARNWTSVGLLTLSVVAVAAVLSGTNVSPDAAGKLGEAIGRILICGGIFAWLARKGGKEYALLTFSIVCAVGAMMFVYYFNVGRQQAKERNRQFAENALDYYTNAVKYVQQGGTGALPEIRLTGDPVNDAISQLMRNEVAGIAATFGRMNDEVDVLAKRDVFDDAVLESVASMHEEERKRTDSIKILEKYRGGLASIMEECKSNVPTAGLTEDQRQGILRGADNTVRNKTPQYNAVIDLRQKRERADLEFLRFKIAAFDDYRLRDGKVLFGSSGNMSRYSELARAVTDSANELEATAKKLLDEGAAATSKIRAIGGLESQRAR